MTTPGTGTRRDALKRQTVEGAGVLSDADRTPRTWPEDVWPTSAELADWLSRCTPAELLDYADRSLTTAQHATRCFTEGHEYRAEAAEQREADLRARIEALAADFTSEIDWSNGRNDYGDNAAWESAARQLRALLDGSKS